MAPQAQEPDSASRLARLFRAVFLAALLVLFNDFPQSVGVWTGPATGWRFLPLLAPAYVQHLGEISVWLALALVLNLILFRRRHWSRATRWLQFAGGAVGTLALVHMATGPRILGVQGEWMARHGWEPELQAEMQRVLELLYPLVNLALLVAFGVLALLSLRRLLRLLAIADPARRLVREGLGERGVAGTLDLLRHDAGRAFAVLDRDQAFGEEPARPVGRLIHRAKVVLHGIAVQLTPARRLLFVVSMVLAGPEKTRWAAVAGLFLLLLLELVDRIRVRDELDLAKSLQRDLLPASAPDLPGYTVAHSFRTANEVGGDYYDFRPTAAGRMALVIGDASGHGMAAGLIMAIASATLKAAVDHAPIPAEVVSQVNRALCSTGGRRAFMTLFYGLLDPASGALDYVCAGHPFPLLLRAGGGILELGSGSLPLGMSSGLPIVSDSVVVEPGDRLLLYSDGLPEALDRPDGESFGFRRVKELLTEGGQAQEIHDRILAAFDSHVGEQPVADDLTLVVLHRLGPQLAAAG